MKKLLIYAIFFAGFLRGYSQTYNLVDNKGVVRQSKVFGTADSSAITSTLTRIGNYLYPKNTTDSFGIGTATPAMLLQVGGSTNALYYDVNGYLNIGSSTISRASVSLNRTLTANYNSGHHGFEDHTIINTTGTPNAYASDDIQPTMIGSGSYDHFVGDQIRHEIQGNATITSRWEGVNITMVNNTSGAIAAQRGISIQDIAGTGVAVVNYQAGLEIASQTKGLLKYAIKTNLGAASFGDTVRAVGPFNILKNLMVGTFTLATLPNAITIKSATLASGLTAGVRIYNSGGSAGVGAGIDLGYADDSTKCGRFGVISDGLNGRSFVWLTAAGTSAQAEVMRLKYNGFLGINTNSPDSMLTVNGGVRLSALFRSNNVSDSMLVMKTSGAIGYRTIPAGASDTSGAAIYTGINSTSEATMSGSATWGGGTPPTGETAKFSWTQNVLTREVTVKFYLSYSVIGATNTSVVIPWQSGMPNPIEHAGLTAASQVLYTGAGIVQGSETSTNTLASKSYLRRNAADNAYEYVITTPAASGKFAIIQLTYDY